MTMTLTQALATKQKGKDKGREFIKRIESGEVLEAKVIADIEILCPNTSKSYRYWYMNGLMSVFDDYVE